MKEMVMDKNRCMTLGLLVWLTHIAELQQACPEIGPVMTY